jgi:hypothetical protein
MKKYLLSGTLCFLLRINLCLYGQAFTSSNLPIVVINTNGQHIDTVNQIFIVSMGVIDHAAGVRNYLTDAYNNFNGEVKIKLHGSSTLSLPKKSYGITILNSLHQEWNYPLFGLPPEHDWVFKAFYQDKTFLRDELAFKIYNEMGHYSSRTKFFELVVNNEYRGVYQVEEKIKRDDFRLNISKLEKTDQCGDALTGGYIISLDKFKPGIDIGWYSKYKSNLTHDSANYFLFRYPNPDDGIPLVQKNYIQNYFDKFESVLANTNFNDPDTGYSKYLNVSSFIDNFIINEVSRNVDGYRSSTYFYKDRNSESDGKLHCGPVWDFNLAWKNASYLGGNNPVGWQYQQFATVNFVPFWWWQIMSDNSFKNQLKCRYQYLRKNILSQAVLFQYIDSMALYLDEAQTRNFVKWPILGQVVYPNPTPVPATYAGEISNLKSWIQQRLAWMDANIPGICQTGITESEIKESFINTFPNPFTGNFNIVYRIPVNAKVKIQVLNTLGKEVLLISDENKTIGTYQQEVDTQILSTGVYIVKLHFNNQAYFKKIVKLE